VPLSASSRWPRRALGACAIVATIVVAAGWRAHHPRAHDPTPTRSSSAAAHIIDNNFPGFPGGTQWINSEPLSVESLRGKVVLIDFWTFGCYNCLNALPHVKELEAKYRDRGLVVVGVHTPEFPYEKDAENVRAAVKRLGVIYPVVMDNDYRIWNAFGNQYWPAAYYVDRKGQIRFQYFGEGNYDGQERIVQQLLAEAASSR